MLGMTSAPRPSYRAYHEAGHAVVTHALGYAVTEVRLDPGSTDVYVPDAGPAPRVEMYLAGWVAARSSIVASDAELDALPERLVVAALLRALRDQYPDDDDGDIARSEQALSATLEPALLTMDVDAFEAYVREVVQQVAARTFDLVHLHWAGITSVAQALEERGTLSRDELLAILTPSLPIG
jgi:hypothetical protein